MRYFILLSGMILILAGSAAGETYVVNPEGTGDFPTIQAAIDSVLDGDIIELTDGTFTGPGNRDLDYLGKAITVRSQNGVADLCVIDCQGSAVEPHRGVLFQSGEGSLSTLEAVSITGGHVTGGSGYGGAVHCHESSPSIMSCVFTGNVAFSGGGVFCGEFASPSLRACTFAGNAADEKGGGLRCNEHSSPEVLGCVFAGNTAHSGGGIYCWLSCDPVMTDCVFMGNEALMWGGGIRCATSCSPMITNCTLFANAAPEGGGVWLSGPPAEVCIDNTIIAFGTVGEAIYCEGHELAVLRCCDVYGNAGGDWVGCIAGQYGIDGNISEDPLFCDPGNGDFTLQDCSPCGPFSPPNPECDLIGAWPIGCSGTSVTETTWGGIKAMFRQ